MWQCGRQLLLVLQLACVCHPGALGAPAAASGPVTAAAASAAAGVGGQGRRALFTAALQGLAQGKEKGVLCYDGIDDDGDGKTDCEDVDCQEDDPAHCAAQIAANGHTTPGTPPPTIIPSAIDPRSLGPGVGPWRTESPEAHGLSGEQLTQAGLELERRLPERYCFLVAKDGALVHEQYAEGYGPHDTYEGDSAMKTVNAAMLGVAVTKGLFQLDVPLASYGVQPQGLWATSANKYWSQVTAKDILGQESGCTADDPSKCVAPGTSFRYDSSTYLMHLSYLLTKTVPKGSTALAWATENFAEPMGLGADWYTHDHLGRSGTDDPDGTEVNIGGGQMTTCRQLLRTGQLALNKGLWLDAHGEVRRLVNEQYMDQLMTPSFPKVMPSYGYLTWLNQPSAKKKAVWADGPVVGGQMVEDNKVEPIQAPYNSAMALGYMAKYLMVLPDQNMTIVTFGNTWGSEDTTDADTGYGHYGETYSLANAWHTLGPALNLCGSMPAVCHTPLCKDTCNTCMQATGGPSTQCTAQCTTTCSQRCRSYAPCYKDPSVSSSGPLSTVGPAPALLTPSPRRFNGGAPLPATLPPAVAGATGSCRCTCPPDQGFGQCFDVTWADTTSADKDTLSARCTTTYQDQASVCAVVGVVKQCKNTTYNPNQSDVPHPLALPGVPAPYNTWTCAQYAAIYGNTCTPSKILLSKNCDANCHKDPTFISQRCPQTCRKLGYVAPRKVITNGCDQVKLGFSPPVGGGGLSLFDCEQVQHCGAPAGLHGSFAPFQISTCRCNTASFDNPGGCGFNPLPCPTSPRSPFFANNLPRTRGAQN